MRSNPAITALLALNAASIALLVFSFIQNQKLKHELENKIVLSPEPPALLSTPHKFPTYLWMKKLKMGLYKGHIAVGGLFENRSGVMIEGLKVYAIFFDANGKVVQTRVSSPEIDPLPDSMTTAFCITTEKLPHIVRAEVKIAAQDGAWIEWMGENEKGQVSLGTLPFKMESQ